MSQLKKISPFRKPEIWLFRHFPKLEIAYYNGKKPFNFSLAKFHSKYFGLLWVNLVAKAGSDRLRGVGRTWHTPKERQVRRFALGDDAGRPEAHDGQRVEVGGVRRHGEDGRVPHRGLPPLHGHPVERARREQQSHQPCHHAANVPRNIKAATPHHQSHR